MTESTGLEPSPSSTNLSTSLVTSEIECDSIVSTSNNVSLSHALLTTGEKVLLQTTRVTICGNNDCKVSAYLLLDSGSQRSFMTEQLAARLKLSLLLRVNVSVNLW